MFKKNNSLFLISIIGLVAISGMFIISIIYSNNSNITNFVGFASAGKNIYQCNDHLDNDGDGFCDYAAGRNSYCSDGSKLGDRDCSGKFDNSEQGPVLVDSDLDGFDSTVDCNDFDASKWKIIQVYKDNDNEGYTVGSLQQLCSGNSLPSGYRSSSLGSDCNDYDSAIYPGAVEFCDNIDNDCDGLIDNIASTSQSCTISNSYGTCSGVTTTSCSAGSLVLSDCSAKTPLLEICGNGVDEDCNGSDSICTTNIGTFDEFYFNQDFTNVTLSGTGSTKRFSTNYNIYGATTYLKENPYLWEYAPPYTDIYMLDNCDSGRRCLFFGNYNDTNSSGTSRTQMSLSFKPPTSTQPVLGTYRFSQRMYFSPDMANLKDFNGTLSGNSWTDLWETWLNRSGNLSWSQDPAGAGRISFEISKDAPIGSPLYWRLTADRVEAPAGQQWSYVWPAQYNKNVPIPFGQWFTLDVTIVDGYYQDGWVYITMTPDGGQKQVLFDWHNSTLYITKEGVKYPEFYRHSVQPFKFYFGDPVLDWMFVRGYKNYALYNDFKWYKNAPTVLTTAPTITTTTTSTTNTQEYNTLSCSEYCTHTIDSSISTISQTSFGGINPGDVLCLSPGTRGKITFSGITGSSTNPVVITNCGGQTIFNGEGLASHTVTFTSGSKYFRMTGTGDSNYQYGIKVINSGVGTTTTSGESAVIATGRSSDMEFDHLEIYGPTFAGFLLKTDPGTAECISTSSYFNFIQYNTKVHDNFISYTEGEGIYAGSSFFTSGHSITCNGVTTKVQPHELHGVRIYNNIIENTGWDGLQVGSATSDVEIYDNKISGSGRLMVGSQDSSIQINPGTVGKVYENYVDGGNFGLFMAGWGDNVVYNNIFLNSRTDGIMTTSRATTSPRNGYGYSFDNNLIINPVRNGIYFLMNETTGSSIRNNLIITTGTGKVIVVDTTKQYSFSMGNNLNYASASNAGFVDANANNYHLTSSSPAVNTGISTSNKGIVLDYDRVSRPQGSNYDVGPYEYK